MADKPRIVATIEARMTSTRLPGKVLKEAVGKPMLALMVERLKQVPSLDDVVIATTTNATDDPVVDLAEALGIGYFRGSEHDVMGRVLGTARAHDIDVIVETTGDCPLIDPDIVERCVQTYFQSDVDYLSNALDRSFPIGMDTQVFAADILADAESRTDDVHDREHVSLFIYSNPQMYSLKNVSAPADLTEPKLALTLDTAEDFELIRQVFEELYPINPEFRLADIFALLQRRPELREINAHVRA